MRCTGLKKQIVTGLLLALLILTASTVKAQWAVYDAANHSAQLTRMAQDVARWVQTLNHYLEEIRKYETMIDKQAEQITSLGNILRTVDEQLARNKSLIYTISSFGQTIRQIFQLQQDIRAMVTCRILAVERVWQRMQQTGMVELRGRSNRSNNICNKVFDERKGELAPTSEINSPWMTEIQLAEYWQLRNKDGALTVHSIRRWTTRPDNPLPCGNLGEIRRYHKDDVDRWAREEAERQRKTNKPKGRNGLHAVGD